MKHTLVARVQDQPGVLKTITVFVGAAKNAAENQFANARAKIQKLARGKKATPATQAAAPAQPAAGTTAAVPAQTARKLPGATDVNNPSALSFAPTGKPETAPLMATPDAKPAVAAKPKPAAPKQKAKADTKPDAKSKPAAAKPATAAKLAAPKQAAAQAPKQQ